MLLVNFFADQHDLDQRELHRKMCPVASGYRHIDVAAVMMNMIVEATVKSCESWEEAESNLESFFKAGKDLLRRSYQTSGKRIDGLGLTQPFATYGMVIRDGVRQP